MTIPIGEIWQIVCVAGLVLFCCMTDMTNDKSLSVTILMKATEQYFPVVLFVMLYKVLVTFESVDEKCDHSNESYRAVLSWGTYYDLQGGSNFLNLWTESQSVTIQMKATEQYFPVVLFIVLYKVVLTFEFVDGISKCDHSNRESY